jgi:nucleoside-diphosphate-sugar epimerase
MAHVLVTGASGRSGRYVVAELVARGHTVRGLYRTSPGTNPNITWCKTDLSQPGALQPLLDGCDAVIHLAAELREPSLMDAVNIDATRRLVVACEEQGIRYFGYASSIVIYGSPRTLFVDELTTRLDPYARMSRQYYAEHYMLNYARTKAAGEIAIEARSPKMIVDFYRPAVVIEGADLLAAGDWSRARKIFAAYRRTQFVTATDAAAALVHLMERGLKTSSGARQTIEAYNIVDHGGGTYRSLFAKAYRATGDKRFKFQLEIPILADMAKDLARHRNVEIRYPLGMMRISNKKLRDTGFVFPESVSHALDAAIAHFRSNGY